jgi:hypothetical protein
MESNIIFLPIALAVLGLLFMFVKMAWVKKQAAGDEKMQGISKAIKEGALAFLGAEYRLLAIFVVIASIALYGISLVVETTSWMIVPCLYFWRHPFCLSREYRDENCYRLKCQNRRSSQDQLTTSTKGVF